MGRPINQRFFGPAGLRVIFNDGSDSNATGYIVRQLSMTRFVVSDGSSEFVVRMARTYGEVASLPEGVMYVDGSGPGVASNATLTPIFGSSQFTVASGGTGYAVNDRVSITSAGAVAAVELRVSSVSGGVVTGLQTWTTGSLVVPPSGTISGNYIVVPSSGVTNTVGSGTGLSVNINFRLITMTVVNGGSDHMLGTVYPVLGTNSGTTPTITIDNVDSNGAILNVSTVVDGGPITSWSGVTLGLPQSEDKAIVRLTANRAWLLNGTVALWGMSGSAPAGGFSVSYWD